MVKLRGYALGDPTVVGLLDSFIVVSWASFDEDDAPEFAREVLWPNGVDFDHDPSRSNVYVFLLDPQGKPVHVFDPRPLGERGDWDETYAGHVADEIRKGTEKLGSEGIRAGSTQDRVPEEEADRALARIISALEPKRTAEYNRPIVEIQELGREDLSTLSYPEGSKRVDAQVFLPCLAHVHPPGVPDRVDPRTGKPLPITSARGELTLSPAGSEGGLRRAVLEGQVTLVLSGPGSDSFEGTLEIVLTYPLGEPLPVSLEGVFRGDFPLHRTETHRSGKTRIGAVFEWSAGSSGS